MTYDPRSVGRRAILRATAATGLSVSLAGCTGGGLLGDEGSDDVVLGPPDGYDEDVAAETVHPTYGDEVPELTVPAPLRDETVTTTDFVGERHSLYTFLFTRCPDACPGLMASLRHVQEGAREDGYADEMALLPVTFDPDHDTPAVLEEYELDHGVDREAGNWYSLRPETPADAREVVEEGFGVAFQKNEDAGHGDGDGRDGDHGDDHDDDGHDEEHDGDDGHDHDEMAFAHTNLVLFVNMDGYVERAYAGAVPTPANVVDDVETVVEGW